MKNGIKILLVYPHFMDPRTQEADISALPMGLYWVAAQLLDAGFDVEILNAWQMGRQPDKIEALIRERKPQVIGFSILHGNRWGGIDLARLTKSVDPNITVVFGGVGASFLWRLLLTHFPQIDYVVTGEGDRTFLYLLDYLQDKSPQEIETIRGVAFRKNGEVVHTGHTPVISEPDRLVDPSRYFAFPHVALTRGCPEKCSFCGSPALWGRRMRFHSPDYFVGQLERLSHKGVRFFMYRTTPSPWTAIG